MLGNRNAQRTFSEVPDVKMARSTFDRSYTVKDTFLFDYLTPCYVEEILPGDTLNLNVNTFMRLSTQKVPIMDRMYVDFLFFFVPNRLVWDNFEKFMGYQENPGDSTDYVLPSLTAPTGTGLNNGLQLGSVFDHLGLPTLVNGVKINNTLPFRGLNLIYNEWFRNQNFVASIPVPKDDGPDVVSDFPMLKSAKGHDYFTGGLPWPQKGPVVGIPGTIVREPNAPQWLAYISGSQSLATDAGLTTVGGGIQGGGGGLSLDPQGGLAFEGTINGLREAFQLQSLFELDARGGTRYTEVVQAHYNVSTGDYRLQRPEFLGSGRVDINSHPVASTTATEDVPQANLAAFGTASSQGKRIGFSKSFVEHGYVLGIMRARADVTYQQGMNRLWNKSTRFDIFWPKLQEIGEQSVLNKEIYAQGTSADDDVFCYQERYGEYRQRPSEIRGLFRSTAPLSLDIWHLAEEFGSLPTLNAVFNDSHTPIERALAVTDQPPLIADIFFQQQHTRPMVAYPTPVGLGRF